MSRLRLFLIWLLLLAIPLQGLAAVSMLYCGPAGQAQQVQAAHAHQDHGHDATHHDAHDHAAPDAGHHVTGAAAGDADPKCSVCAACHVVAISESRSAFTFAAAPQLPWVEVFQPVHSRPSPVPDKPPRA